ncbi:hypothetical protein ACO0LG_22685 [Undibacterium sp. Ji42W]|uniref:hypothetical protein n=1 Tax=Undibacterium sp. Ji42W TaxID=3413039 RepID=UPI003BF30B09
MTENGEVSFYDQTGRITMTGALSPATLAHYDSIGATYVAGIYDTNLCFVQGGALVARPESPVILVGFELVDVHVGSVVCINKSKYVAESDTVHLSLTYPGDYDVTVLDFPYQDAVFKVTKT